MKMPFFRELREFRLTKHRFPSPRLPLPPIYRSITSSSPGKPPPISKALSARFIIERDGVATATVPKKPTNNFGRPVFQKLQYSDTPAQSLAQMRFTDPKPEAVKAHKYRIIAVNSFGVKSK